MRALGGRTGQALVIVVGPDVRVLILSMHDNEQFIFEALRAGASGYVLKSAAESDLVSACRTCAASRSSTPRPSVRSCATTSAAWSGAS